MFLRKNFFYFALLMIVSVFVMPSCSEDDDVTGGENPPAEHVPNPAGDDFYMYVNEDWHNSLTDTGESQGYSRDIRTLLSEKTTAMVPSMDEVMTVAKSLLDCANGKQEANEKRLDAIIKDLKAEMTSKEDAYRVIGKCVSMGLLDEYIKIYMIFNEDKICYTIGPKVIDEEGGAAMAGIFSSKKINFKNYKKLSAQSRGVDEVLVGIVEGIGLGIEDFMYDEDLMGDVIEELSKCSLKDLKDFVSECTEAELLPFCYDEYAQQVSDGKIPTISHYFDVEFPNLFTYSISYHFNKQYVSAETKEKFKQYGEEMRSVFAKRIENNSWLSAQTKQAALNKLANMKFCFGGPDEWAEEGFPAPKGELLIDDLIEVKSSRTRLIQAKLGKDIREESMTLLMFVPGGEPLNVHNAFYSLYNNAMNVLPSFLIEPEYTPDMDPSAMYAVFYVMGHEMTHGFDIEGAEFDADGHEANWWTAEDKAKFLELNNKFIKQIGTHEAAPGVMANGELTIGEYVADLGGLNIAFDALTEYLKKQGVSGEQLKKAQKDFYEYYAYRYRTQYNEADLQAQLEDEHGVDKVRVNAMVQHMDSWYELFNVVEGDLLYLPKEERINIW